MLNEARALARLDHPNIVSVYDCFEHGDHLYLVREYVEGITLHQWLQDLAPESTCRRTKPRSCRGMLKGLAYAHERRVIHRHIHPKNIILSGDQVKIMNFGLEESPTRTDPDRAA